MNETEFILFFLVQLGYKLTDFADIVPLLNVGLHQRPREQIKTVRNKYSHEIFFGVAKIKLLNSKELFDCNANENTSSTVSPINNSCSSNVVRRSCGNGNSKKHFV